jgi:ElaB/YqjD/DUF883 family membrane-anchored ribosome-binding protein
MAERSEKAAAKKPGTKKPAAREPDPKGGGETGSPEEIQAEIDATREELGDTVAAVAAKADVKGQAKQKATETKERAKAKVTGAAQQAKAKREEFAVKAQGATPESANQAAQQATKAVQENPVPAAAAGSFAAGLFLGWLIGRR